MCNLYSLTRSQDALRRLFHISQDLTGNLGPHEAIFPDMSAPVVRQHEGQRRLETMRWGFPAPAGFSARKLTNVRNPISPYWRPWLKPEFRCLVPASSFCEWTDGAPKVPHWFALHGAQPRPTFAFAGIWRPWTGMRGGESRDHRLFAFLTTEANDLVRRIHAKAMPVILQSEDWSAWLTEPSERALALQKPLASDALRIVVVGERADTGEPALHQEE